MKESNLVQNLISLKRLPSQWKIKYFTDVVSDNSGGNKKLAKSDFLQEGEIAIVDQGKEMIAGYFNDNELIVKSKPPYIVFGDHTRIFKYIDFPFIMGADGTKVLQPKDEETYTKYLYYFFLSINVPDTGYNRHFKYLKELQIPLPPLDQQKKIAFILDAADAFRQKTKALLAKYDELTQSLFLDMFGDPVKNEKGWDQVMFTDVLVLKRGYDLPVQDRVYGSHPIMASNGILDWHNEYKVKGPGIVTGRSGTLGQVHMVNTDYWPLNTALYSQNLKDNNPLYILFLLRNFKVERFARGAGVPTLNRNLVHNELIINVPLNLQNQFAERVQAIEQQKASAQASYEKAEELFNSLLQKAFNGELV
jgi:type I restriction enzyme S subunit